MGAPCGRVVAPVVTLTGSARGPVAGAVPKLGGRPSGAFGAAVTGPGSCCRCCGSGVDEVPTMSAVTMVHLKRERGVLVPT